MFPVLLNFMSHNTKRKLQGFKTEMLSQILISKQILWFYFHNPWTFRYKQRIYIFEI